MSILIREIQPRDNAAIAQIIRQVLTEFGANRPGFAWSDPELDHLAQAYAPDGCVYYVAAAGDCVVGGVGIAPFECDHPHTCELQKMYLLPDYRGQGIGKRLMTTVLTAADGLGYHACYLETLDAMTLALRFYEAFGFEALPAPLGQSGHTSCNRFYFRKLPFVPALPVDRALG